VAFRDAQARGTLDEGLVHITLDGETTVDIFQVFSGRFAQILPGGSYQVWVRWRPTGLTLAEWAAEKLAAYELMLQPAEPDSAEHHDIAGRIARGRFLVACARGIPGEDRKTRSMGP
jgi:hypothetical protein